jgi:hypothetical protein
VLGCLDVLRYTLHRLLSGGGGGGGYGGGGGGAGEITLAQQSTLQAEVESHLLWVNG